MRGKQKRTNKCTSLTNSGGTVGFGVESEVLDEEGDQSLGDDGRHLQLFAGLGQLVDEHGRLYPVLGVTVLLAHPHQRGQHLMCEPADGTGE